MHVTVDDIMLFVINTNNITILSISSTNNLYIQNSYI